MDNIGKRVLISWFLSAVITVLICMAINPPAWLASMLGFVGYFPVYVGVGAFFNRRRS